MVIGSFGGRLIFEVSGGVVFTPQSVKRDVKARYEEHQVLGAKPRLEFLAPELTTFSLTVVLSAAHGVDPASRLSRIAECVEEGAAEILVLGGMRHGWHVIEEASEEWRHTLPDGRILTAQVSLTFKEYVK